MYALDRDALLVHLRLLSFGTEMEMEWTCSKCEGENVDELDLTELEVREWPEDAPVTIAFALPRGIRHDGRRIKTGELRLPTGIDQEAIAEIGSRDPGAAATAMIAACIDNVEGVKVTVEMAQRMSSLDRRHLSRTLRDQIPGIKLQAEVQCGTCWRVEEAQRINLSDFFSLI
jgi:hypothetical protein